MDDADHVIVIDIYPAREPHDPTITGAQVAAALDHVHAEYISELKAAAAALETQIEPGDVVITLSAGDGNEVGRLLLEGQRAEEGGSSNGQEQG